MKQYYWSFGIAFLLFGPLLGAFLAGIDRRLTARLQSRKGPPLLQPFYDVGKLLQKRTSVVTPVQTLYIWCSVFFMAVSGSILFIGSDLLIALFALTVSGIFLALAAYAANSPYSEIGSSRELLLMMAYEPMMIFVPLGFLLANGSLRAADVVAGRPWQPLELIGILLGFLFVLTIKLRKSPFDLSSSHHGHQELVKGMMTDISGRDLALVEVSHWYENTILLGWLYLFFAPWGWVIALPLALILFFVETFVDNTNARLKWGTTVRGSWWVAGILGVPNLLLLSYVR